MNKSKVYLGYEQSGFQGVDKDYIEKIFTLTLEAAESEAKEVGLMIISDAEIQDLNNRYRDKDEPTNVLSFTEEDFKEIDSSAEVETEDYLGDIYIAYATTCREAEDLECSQRDRFTHLFIHGILHLLGYEHKTEEGRKEMETLEDEIMVKLKTQ